MFEHRGSADEQPALVATHAIDVQAKKARNRKPAHPDGSSLRAPEMGDYNDDKA